MASLKVAVRVRPFNNREREMNAKSIVQMDGEKTRLLKKPENVSIDSASISSTFHDFTFDYSYWSGDGPHHIVSQKEIYDDLGVDVIECAFQGYNACLLAYGQTVLMACDLSGKSLTDFPTTIY
ncbi:kinesin-like protein Klp98A [Sitodiplosis mosellana]|uniref:kinesin-like protein Klp98A n=1 Tax=Sitodiplosis mosellana TaxID=263140 RepID=UPI002444D1F5|nr:kinesin-like protein Klp98A [Sitodiplosis mosellana]